ncbi:MAG: 3'(2'),5'-bisphosphate nucleotidase [bacterium]|nr:3'(2'),5'-bisphosphate nucleotidase [bacterium]
MIRPWADHSLAKELDVALKAVREAGLLCRSVQSLIDPGTLKKEDKSPVTVADFGSQALVCRTLGEAFADDPVIGEEDSADLRVPGNEDTLEQMVGHVQKLRPEARTDEICGWIDRGGSKEYAPRFWTLDPIDGTKGFLRKMQYAISLALIIDGKIEVAALGCPNLGSGLKGDRGAGTVFLAIRGVGVWQVPLVEEGAPIVVSASRQTDTTQIRFCESVESAHSSHSDSARIAEHLAIVAEPARLDSQTKYAVVARGEAEAYLRLPRDNKYKEKIWDHAGGVLVVLEAGGQVTDIKGRPLDFTQGYKLDNNLGVIVSNGHVHQAVLDTIVELGIGEF